MLLLVLLGIIAEVYLGPYKTSAMKLFPANKSQNSF